VTAPQTQTKSARDSAGRKVPFLVKDARHPPHNSAARLQHLAAGELADELYLPDGATIAGNSRVPPRLARVQGNAVVSIDDTKVAKATPRPPRATTPQKAPVTPLAFANV